MLFLRHLPTQPYAHCLLAYETHDGALELRFGHLNRLCKLHIEYLLPRELQRSLQERLQKLPHQQQALPSDHSLTIELFQLTKDFHLPVELLGFHQRHHRPNRQYPYHHGNEY